MRRFTTILMMVCLAVAYSSGQQRILIDKSMQDLSLTGEFKTPIADLPEPADNSASPFQAVSSVTGNKNGVSEAEDQIGTTWYDLQSNAFLSNRVHFYPDGTAAAVWIMGFNAVSFPDRGTGYNYFDGTSWGPQPTARIESERTGWPTYAPYGVNGEIVVAHTWGASQEGLLINSRNTKGTGGWQQTLFQGPAGGWEHLAWPRMTTSGSGNNTTHIVAMTLPEANGGSIYYGQDGALLYNRSQDGGQTWDIQHQVLPGMGSGYYNHIAADGYGWAEPRGNTIAFVVGDLWHDMFVMKSTDNGNTWAKLMVWEHPYPFFDFDNTIMIDTLWAPDKSVDIAIDQNGKVHLVCGLMRVLHTEPGTNYSFWPNSDGIAYWNDNRPPFTAANPHDALDPVDILISDYNLIGWTQDVNGNGSIDFLQDIMTYRQLGISTMPEISIDEYIIYFCYMPLQQKLMIMEHTITNISGPGVPMMVPRPGAYSETLLLT
ncbi:MAG: glycoside hydrolase [Bacteroidales bacterium]|nr:glycoside hydrolase [Bacteroidales bacterium]